MHAFFDQGGGGIVNNGNTSVDPFASPFFGQQSVGLFGSNGFSQTLSNGQQGIRDGGLFTTTFMQPPALPTPMSPALPMIPAQSAPVYQGFPTSSAVSNFTPQSHHGQPSHMVHSAHVSNTTTSMSQSHPITPMKAWAPAVPVTPTPTQSNSVAQSTPPASTINGHAASTSGGFTNGHTQATSNMQQHAPPIQLFQSHTTAATNHLRAPTPSHSIPTKPQLTFPGGDAHITPNRSHPPSPAIQPMQPTDMPKFQPQHQQAQTPPKSTHADGHQMNGTTQPVASGASALPNTAVAFPPAVPSFPPATMPLRPAPLSHIGQPASAASASLVPPQTSRDPSPARHTPGPIPSTPAPASVLPAPTAVASRVSIHPSSATSAPSSSPSAIHHVAPFAPQSSVAQVPVVASLPVPPAAPVTVSHSIASSVAPAVSSSASVIPAETIRPTITPERKRELLAKANSLYDKHHKHSRVLEKHVHDLRTQLVQAKLAQSVQVVQAVIPPPQPPFSENPESSPLAMEVAGSADPALLALLENSKAIEDALARKRSLTEQIGGMVERVGVFVKETVEKETKRAHERRDHGDDERKVGGRWPDSASSSMEDDGVDDLESSLKLPDFILPSHHPVIRSMQAHITSLQTSNQLTSSLLLLKNKSLAEQQEQSTMLHNSLREQLEELTKKLERREREMKEEREMLVGGLQQMVEMLAKENEELKKEKKAANGAAERTASAVQSGHHPSSAIAHASPTALPSRPAILDTFPLTTAANSSLSSSRSSSAMTPAGSSLPRPPPPTLPASTISGSASALSLPPFVHPPPFPTELPLTGTPQPALARPNGFHVPPPAFPSLPSIPPPAHPSLALDNTTKSLLASPPFAGRPSFLPPMSDLTPPLHTPPRHDPPKDLTRFGIEPNPVSSEEREDEES